ncbi:MAG TPA: aminomethyltransferase family protein [Nitrospira sp.]|jgi:aminomethyltransferase|nr:aminomethyltransferase family protein [Nitrospira sp.]
MTQSRLHDHHAKLNAAFEEVTGWQVPARYGDMLAEYRAVRERVGIADLSHRGKLRVTGEDRVKWLQSVISNDLLALKPGEGRYSSLLTHKGKMLTYFRCYMQNDAVMLEDVGEIGDQTFLALKKFLLYGTKAKLENCRESWGLLLVSGPKAAAVMQAAFGTDIDDLRPVSFISAAIGGQTALVVSSEETGERDVEILTPADGLVAAWERLMEAGAPYGITPVGSEAREALRLEAGIPKAGPDLNEEIVPPEANLQDKAFSLSKGCYPGQEVVARMDTYGSVRRHLVGLVVKSSVVPPKGAKLFSGNREVGWVSSAVLSPLLKAPIALGFPLRDFSQAGTALSIDVDGVRHEAAVQALPFRGISS